MRQGTLWYKQHRPPLLVRGESTLAASMLLPAQDGCLVHSVSCTQVASVQGMPPFIRNSMYLVRTMGGKGNHVNHYAKGYRSAVCGGLWQEERKAKTECQQLFPPAATPSVLINPSSCYLSHQVQRAAETPQQHMQ